MADTMSGRPMTDEEWDAHLQELLGRLHDDVVSRLSDLAEAMHAEAADGTDAATMAGRSIVFRGRFEELEAELAARGAHDPAGLAAYIGRRKYGHAAFADMAAAAHHHGGEEHRSDTFGRDTFFRSWALEDISIQRGGDGRTVTAYAAVFNTPAEVKDRFGHYYEVIDRAAFNRTVANNLGKIGVFYNHAMTLHGTPSELGSVPIGRPVDIRPDQRGLVTVSRFNATPLADSVLESINNGDITAYSFQGKVYRSNPERVPVRRNGGPLPTVVRHELGLTEYGPTPIPVYSAAAITAVRSATTIAEDIAGLTEAERADLIRALSSTTPPPPAGPETTTATRAQPRPGAEDPRTAHSARQSDIARRIRVALVTRSAQ